MVIIKKKVLVQGDTKPDIKFQIINDETGLVYTTIPTGSTVYLSLYNIPTESYTNTGHISCTWYNEALKIGLYDRQAGDTAEVGDYYGEVKVVTPLGDSIHPIRKLEFIVRQKRDTT